MIIFYKWFIDLKSSGEPAGIKDGWRVDACLLIAYTQSYACTMSITPALISKRVANGGYSRECLADQVYPASGLILDSKQCSYVRFEMN